jgi:dTDP-3-amino-2,3,6-trideoxy-4-keto-D-glucose/dTDP-3-amino-3,4,6-trideoxy-alpha-D-glucose/dTDP-2,6-dideoxy-D-kanosamine transaminase
MQQRSSGSIRGVIAMNDLKRELAPIRPDLEAAIQRVLDSGWFVLGPECEAFENAFARYLGGGHAAGVGNGSDALEIALRALDIGPGDKVITVANAGGYATSAILAVGAVPVYTDVDAETGLIDPQQLPLDAKPAAAAIIVTHLYGRMADMDVLLERVNEHKLAVIEDCAQAHGAKLNSRAAGSWGELGCFSFYPTKNLGALGDGGAIFGRDRALIDRVRALRQYGWAEKYKSTVSGGRNSRLDELQAACLAARLPCLDQDNEKRRAVARRYFDGISNTAIGLPARSVDDRDVFHLFTVQSAQRAALMAHLAEHRIASAIHYPCPDYRQPAWQQQVSSATLAVTERRSEQILSLPCHPALSDQEINHVIDACNRFRP